VDKIPATLDVGKLGIEKYASVRAANKD